MAREVILLLTLFQHYYPSTFKVFLAIPIPPPLKRGILLNIFLSVKFKINAGSVKIRSESKTQIFSNTVSFAWPTLIRFFFSKFKHFSILGNAKGGKCCLYSYTISIWWSNNESYHENVRFHNPKGALNYLRQSEDQEALL